MQNVRITNQLAKTFVVFILAALCSAFPLSALADNSAVSTTTREGRLAVFDDAWWTINQRYYDPSFKGVDWELQRTVFRALAAESSSGQELYAVLRRMIGLLNDPHTRVFSPEEKFDWWRPRSVTTGISVREIDGLPTVVYVQKGSAPDIAGVRIGDVIEGVDHEPALSLINRRIETVQSRFRAFSALFDGPAGTMVTVRWKRKDGKTREATFQRYWHERELGVRARRMDGNILVIEIDAFTKPIVKSFAALLRDKLDSTRGIVLDLRGNGGGEAESMVDVASAFLSNGYELGRFTDRAGGSFEISTRLHSLLMTERIESIKLPIVVLSSERTSSAAEILIEALKTSGRARVIGTATCGCVLAIRTRHVLPDGGLLDVSELDYQTAQGQHLERRGIAPDETVTVTRDELYSGHDRAMEIASRHLQSRRQHSAK